jgi:hypothetical protein
LELLAIHTSSLISSAQVNNEGENMGTPFDIVPRVSRTSVSAGPGRAIEQRQATKRAYCTLMLGKCQYADGFSESRVNIGGCDGAVSKPLMAPRAFARAGEPVK